MQPTSKIYGGDFLPCGVISREIYTEATLGRLVPMIPQDLYKSGVELPPAIDDSDEQAEEKNEE